MADWQVVLKNNSGADILIADLGLTILNGTSEDMSSQIGYSELADSENLKTIVSAGTLVVNDGTADLSPTNGLAFIRRANKKYVDDQISNIDVSAATDPIQTELDNVESSLGEMVNTDGTFASPTGTNYINGATSMSDASTKLDAQIKTNEDAIAGNASDISTIGNSIGNVQSELDTTQTGAGLNSDGTYTANSSANYIDGATSLKDADNALDAKIKANEDAISALGTGSITDLQNEVDAIEAGSGLETDGTYSADTTTNYLGSATSLKGANHALDAQVKANADVGTQNASDISTNSAGIAQNSTDISTNTDNIATNATAISNEATSRTSADAAIQAELDAAEAGAGLEIDGTYAADNTTNYIGTATSLKDADSLLDSEVKTVADSVTQEATDRATADALKVDKAGDTMTGNLVMGTNEVLLSSVPSGPTSATNREYVDSVGSGFAPKAPVIVVADSNVSLTGLQTIDGVTLVDGDRVLLTGQTDATENGSYNVSSGTWTRTTDFDGTPASEVSAGSRFYAKQGSVYAGAAFTLLGTVGQEFTPDTDTLTFGQTGGSEAVSNVQGEVDTIESAVGLNQDGTYNSASTSNYIGGATSSKNADELLDAQIKTNEDAVSANAVNIATNTSDIGTLDTRTTALEDKSGSFGVVNGILVGKDTVRSKWLGYRSNFLFAIKGKAKNRYLKAGGVPSNLSAPPVVDNMTITSLAIQLKNVAGADATFNILKNASPVVLGSLVVTAGNASASVNTLDIDLSAGDYIQLQVSSTQAVVDPVTTLIAAFNGGSV